MQTSSIPFIDVLIATMITLMILGEVTLISNPIKDKTSEEISAYKWLHTNIEKIEDILSLNNITYASLKIKQTFRKHFNSDLEIKLVKEINIPPDHIIACYFFTKYKLWVVIYEKEE